MAGGPTMNCRWLSYFPGGDGELRRVPVALDDHPGAGVHRRREAADQSCVGKPRHRPPSRASSPRTRSSPSTEFLSTWDDVASDPGNLDRPAVVTVERAGQRIDLRR